MTYTNERNLPAPLVRALQAHTYDRQTNRVSVTDLLKSERAYTLTRRHEAEIVEDVSDNLWRFLGTAVAAMLEKGEGGNDLKEERLTLGDLTGRIDLYEGDTGTLYDYKVTSTYKIKSGDYADYILQLSVYAHLIEAVLGFPVKKIANVLILRDWTKRDAEIAACPIQVIYHQRIDDVDDVPLAKWVDEKINLLRTVELLPDSALPECSAAYRWATPDRWAVMWNESKAAEPRAVSMHDTQAEAEAAASICDASAKGKKTYRAEFRRGDACKRCEYCGARTFCNQYAELSAGKI